MADNSRVRGTRLGGLLCVAGALVLGGCSGQGATGGAAASVTSAAEGAAAGVSSGASAAGSAAGSGAPSGSPVRCSGSSCSVTLTGDVSSVSVLGTQVTFGGVQNGQATIGVGGRQLTCRQGESVSAGPLRLTCTTVQPDRVTLTGGLGG
jgi:hypothetical protein